MTDTPENFMFLNGKCFPNELVMFEKCIVAFENLFFMYGKVTRAQQQSEDDINEISAMREAIQELKLKVWHWALTPFYFRKSHNIVRWFGYFWKHRYKYNYQTSEQDENC